MAALLFWLVAAVLVAASHAALDRSSIAAGTFVEIVSIVAAAFGYMRFAARDATVDHAFGVGIAWLLLSVLSELALASHALLGSPARPVIRNVFLFVWIFSPALFARRTGAR
jgi:hypothetical protein